VPTPGGRRPYESLYWPTSAIQRASRTALSRCVIGNDLRAAAVFPSVISKLPLRPLTQVIGIEFPLRNYAFEVSLTGHGE